MGMNMKRALSLIFVVSGIALLFTALPSAVQGQADKNEEIYLYKGSDREKQLIQKAKQEGKVVLYTSLGLTESVPLTQAFEKKYGIKVELWRAVSEKIAQRAQTEARAKHHAVDVIETNAPELEILAREKVVTEFHSPYFKDLPPQAIPPNRQWVADRFNFWVMGYNTNLVKKDEIPKSYEDILNPKWKGKIGMEAGNAEWFATIVKIWGEDKGLAYFKKLAEMRPDMRNGHILLAELVSAGEIPIALTAYNHNIENSKKKGAPVDWTPLQPAIARPNGVALAKHAPHPHAALLFADFLLSPEGQELFNSLGRVPASLKVKSNMNNFPYTMVDPIVVLDEWDKWNKLWEDLFIKK